MDSEGKGKEEEKEEEEEIDYGTICNLGHRTPLNTEDAFEIAAALCQGGVMDRSKVRGENGEGEVEVLECLACEWGSWNMDTGAENKE